jgi:diguanylate cyclase (GGDEF)-like protein
MNTTTQKNDLIFSYSSGNLGEAKSLFTSMYLYLNSVASKKASIFLLSPQSDELELRMVYGVDEEIIKKRVTMHIGEGIAGKVLESGEGMIVNEGEEHPDFIKDEEIKEYGVSTLMCVPLKIKDKSFGVLNVSNKTDNKPYTDNDFKLFQALASQIAINIENTKLYELSITDGITKLFIHRHFQVRLEEEIIRARRYNSPVSLIMIDIDHFKKFNDTYGHQTGDLVLIKVAETIKSTVRTNVDIAARYGGEEFAIILPETGKEEAALLAERLRKNIESKKLFTNKYGELKVTVSLGISGFPNDANNKSELISKADAALYKAKETGRNKLCIAD